MSLHQVGAELAIEPTLTGQLIVDRIALPALEEQLALDDRGVLDHEGAGWRRDGIAAGPVDVEDGCDVAVDLGHGQGGAGTILPHALAPDAEELLQLRVSIGARGLEDHIHLDVAELAAEDLIRSRRRRSGRRRGLDDLCVGRGESEQRNANGCSEQRTKRIHNKVLPLRL